MRTGIINRIKKVEALHGPGPGLEAMVIDRRPGESNEVALARFWAKTPELWNAQAPRIYLCLSRGAPE
jgi:hypothetical protein